MDGAPPQSPGGGQGTPLAGAPSPYPMLASPAQTQVVNPLQMLQVAPGTPMTQSQDGVIARTMSIPQLPQMGVSGLLVLHQGSRFTKTMHVSSGSLRGVPAIVGASGGARSSAPAVLQNRRRIG